MYVDGTPVLGTGSGSASIGLTNYATSFPSTWSGGSNINSGAGLWTNGVPMLGYLQPYNSESDESAFVYYSNLRVVELSPYITQQPASTLVSAGTNVTLTATASYATQPGMTNVWHTSANGTPAAIVTTDTSAGTNFPDSLTLNSVTTGSNYFTVFSDSAGTITNAYPAVVEVITGPANQAVGAGFPAT